MFPYRAYEVVDDGPIPWLPQKNLILDFGKFPFGMYVGQFGCSIIWASVKLGDTLGMLIWLETINGILCCFGGYTDK